MALSLALTTLEVAQARPDIFAEQEGLGPQSERARLE